MNYLNTLETLCAIGGPSGFEEEIANVAQTMLLPLCDTVYKTRLGSVVGVKKCGKADAPRVMLDAHLDEIGFIITAVEDGFLRFQTIGGVDRRMLPGREVTVLTNPPIHGVITSMPPHLQKADEQDTSIALDKLYIDIGLSQEKAQQMVSPGTAAVYAGGCEALGSELICGKALDDRACFAILLHTLELIKNCEFDFDLYILGSTCEEVDSRGAITAAFEIAPDYCIAVDVTHGSTPDAPKEKTFPLGDGPVIGVGPNCTKSITNMLFSVAQTHNISVQTEVMAGHSGTNAWPIQISREGVATAVLSLPLRYMHSPVETACLSDMHQCATLLAEFLKSFAKEALNHA